jgi:hypothetical protein
VARRRRTAVDVDEVEVDDVAVRLTAAQRAFVVAGGVHASTAWDGPDGRFWSRWCRSRLAPEDREAQIAHYLAAVERLDAMEVFDRMVARYRRLAELNTEAARAARHRRSA